MNGKQLCYSYFCFPSQLGQLHVVIVPLRANSSKKRLVLEDSFLRVANRKMFCKNGEKMVHFCTQDDLYEFGMSSGEIQVIQSSACCGISQIMF